MNIELKIPQDWNDITLSQYKQLLMLPSMYNLENIEDQYEYKKAQMSIINPHLDIEDIGKMKMSQAIDYYNRIEFINNQPVLENCKTINIDGKVYTFGDFKNMTMDQWIDTEKYGTRTEDCNKLIAIFYINGDEYCAKEHDKVSEWLDKAPATKYFWSVSFFLFIQTASELAFRHYSNKLMSKLEWKKRVEKNKKIIKEAMKKFGLI